MSLKNLTSRMKKGPTEAVGIDFGQNSTKVVRLRKNGDAVILDGAEMLPSIEKGGGFSLPAKLKARYAAIAVSSPEATAKLLTFPGAIDATFENNLAKSMGQESDSDDRIAYRIITEGSGRSESRVLATTLPESVAEAVMSLFKTGLPAPSSLELSPLAALTAFEAGPVTHNTSSAASLIDFGSESSTLSIFYKHTLVLLRRFDFGTKKLLERVTAALHIDTETALNILSDNAFDISELLTDIISPLSSQLIVSREFIERRENCKLKHMHCIGGLTSSPTAMQELERAMGIEVKTFDPFTIPILDTSSQDNGGVSNQNWQYCAAIGAALGTLQEES